MADPSLVNSDCVRNPFRSFHFISAGNREKIILTGEKFEVTPGDGEKGKVRAQKLVLVKRIGECIII